MIVESGGEIFVVFRLGDTLTEIVQQITDVVLENNGHNVTKAAKALGLKRTALAMRLKKEREGLNAD